jgi:hypothetical protein
LEAKTALTIQITSTKLSTQHLAIGIVGVQARHKVKARVIFAERQLRARARLDSAPRLQATLEELRRAPFDGVRAHEALERLRVIADIGRLSERDRLMASLAAITASAGKAAIRR